MEASANVPSRQVPPPDFPLRGLAGWAGVLALDLVQGQNGTPPSAVWIAHTRDDDRAGVRVGSISRRNPFWLQQPQDDVLTAIADRATHSLFEMTLPRDHEFLREHHHLLSRRFREETRNPAGWARIPWRIDDNDVSAAVYRFAGGWAAYTDCMHEVFLAANGIGVEPAGLEFERVDDERYGFDPRQPLPTSMPDARTRQIPITRLRNPNMTTPHADHRALLAAS